MPALAASFRLVSEDTLQKKVFDYFAGEWSVRRRFVGSYTGDFRGTARFTRNDSETHAYLYEEEGALKDASGNQFNARQVYCYRLRDSKFEVLKRDSAGWMVLHELLLVPEGNRLTAGHLHVCGEDCYTVEYRIDLSGGWALGYVVKGPKKDYRIYSAYARV